MDLPKFYEVVGRDAEFVYGATPWLPELVELRAGGLIPIARQYPGAREFVESYKKEFPGADLHYLAVSGYGGCQTLVASGACQGPGRRLDPDCAAVPGAPEFVEAYSTEFAGADLSYQSARGYGGCQILVEAIRRAGSLDSGKLRDAISKMDHNTVFGAFRVDQNGLQIAHKMVMFQWQDGKKVIVWPEELAPGQARFPTPPWNQAREQGREGLRRRGARGALVGGRAGRGGAGAHPDRRDARPDRRVCGVQSEPAPWLPALRQAPASG